MDWIELPLKGGRQAHPVFWPHNFFSAVYKTRPELWTKRLLGKPGAALEFWQSMEQSDFVQKHPFLPRDSWKSIIPLGFHGDAGAHSNYDSIYCFNWNSLLSEGATIQTRFLFTVVPKNQMTPTTLDALMQAFAWSMNVLLSGQTPHQDYRGQPIPDGGIDLADGYRAALVQIRGDWEFYVNLFGFPSWNTNARMCPFCRASNTIRGLLWSDFSLDAAWRNTIFDHESYMAYLHANGLAPPILFAAAGVIGLRLECVMVDVLHTIDLGFASHIIGNVLWYFFVVCAVLGGTNIEAKIAKCAEDMQEWYSDTNCKYRLQGKLTEERLRSKSDWPKLKAKAAQTRYLARYALHVAIRFAQLQSLDEFTRLHDELCLAACQLLVEFYDILEAQSMFLSAAAKARLPKLANELTGIYTRLSNLAFGRSMKLWKLSPKMHLFLHLCLHQAIFYGNPRYYWTYGDEDMVRILIGVADMLHPKTLAQSVLFKWLWCVYDELLIDDDDD